MTVRPPRPLTTIWTDNPAAALDYEIAQEKAADARPARPRAGGGTCGAARLRRGGARAFGRGAERAARSLVAQAGHALWLFVVQREAIGLRDTRQLMRDYRVPAEVQHRMGVLPARNTSS